MNLNSRKCTSCGSSPVSPDWTFKTTAYCSFRCYAKSSARLLLLLSTIFGALFAGLMCVFYFTVGPPEAFILFIPVSVPLIFGPIPGYFISFLGFWYKRRDKKKTPITVHHEEETIKTDETPICSLCNSSILEKDKIAIIEPCMHEFHRTHLAKWVEENYNCPKCNEEIEKITFAEKK